MANISEFNCHGSTVTYRRAAHDVHFEEVFCGTCYARVFNKNRALHDFIFLRAGTLSRSPQLEPIAHIWTKRKQPWISLPVGVATFEESPTPEQFGAVIAAAKRRRSSCASG
jgi:hypothetical protein